MSKPYHSLLVWQRAHEYVLLIYRFTKYFPSEEKFGLTSQLRRAAMSVPANIVEGYARFSTKDRKRFFDIAVASLAETEYFLELARDLKYVDTDKYQELECLRSKTSYLLNKYRDSLS